MNTTSKSSASLIKKKSYDFKGKILIFLCNKGKHIYFEVHAQFTKLLKNTSYCTHTVTFHAYTRVHLVLYKCRVASSTFSQFQEYLLFI